MIRKLFIAFAIGSALILTACGGDDSHPQAAPPPPAAPAPQPQQPAQPAPQQDPSGGQPVFNPTMPQNGEAYGQCQCDNYYGCYVLDKQNEAWPVNCCNQRAADGGYYVSGY